MAITPTPLWLEIRTEYIDANLEKVITYLSRGKASSEADAFYDVTLNLLEKRVRELIECLSEKSLDEDIVENSYDSEKVLKIIGSFLLMKGASSETLVKEALFFFIKTLTKRASQAYTEDLIALAVSSLTKKDIASYGFDWGNIQDIQADVIAYKILNNLQLSDQFCADTWYQNRGALRIKDGFVEIYSVNKSEALYTRQASSLQLLDETLVICSNPSDRIKEKDSNSIEMMEFFTSAFIGAQMKVKPSPEKALKVYEQGDTLPVRYLGKDSSGALVVETVEGDHEYIKGTIHSKGSLFYYYNFEHFASVFREGDIFDVKLQNAAKKTFSIRESFIKSLIDDTVVTGKEVNAILKHVNSRGQMVWWTSDGYPAYVDDDDCECGFEIGDAAVLMITQKSSNGYVQAIVVDRSDEQIDDDESRNYCIEGMLYADDTEFSAVPVRNVLSESLVKGLSRLLFTYQKTVVRASERFRILCVCRILAVLADDQLAKSYVDVTCSYLKNLVCFADGRIEDIKTLELPVRFADVPAIKRKKEIVELLKIYGMESESDYLSNIIAGDSQDDVVVKLAKLIQSCNRIDDVYPAVKNVIKLEITKYLAVQTEDNTDFEETSGPNLGIENIRQEFKTSFLVAPPNAKQQNQEKTVFRTLCSFLNTAEGGTLYLGINDGGGICGLELDLERLERKTGRYYSGLDGYVRYITDRAREYFDLDVRLCFRIEPEFDNKVVAIHVEPYKYGVVTFEGIPYIRNNSESVIMSQTLKMQIQAKRIRQMKDSSSLVVALGVAINEEKKVILHNYSSSNSQDVRDRHVEPFAFLNGSAYVWCYDLDAQMNKLFRVSRIGNVQVTQEGWEMKARHEKGKCDIFHFTGDNEIYVKLELDQMAKNLLVEEYPDAANELTKGMDGSWILETVCRQIYGVGRFYVGLVSHIKILLAPELKIYADKYFKNALIDLGNDLSVG